MNHKKWLYSGIAVFIVTTLIGILGTFWGVYSSFDALERAENSGIGPVSAGIQNALIFTIVGLLGSTIGIALIVVGGIKVYRQSKSETSSPSGHQDS